MKLIQHHILLSGIVLLCIKPGLSQESFKFSILLKENNKNKTEHTIQWLKQFTGTESVVYNEANAEFEVNTTKRIDENILRGKLKKNNLILDYFKESGQNGQLNENTDLQNKNGIQAKELKRSYENKKTTYSEPYKRY
jgi:hypothetical protein